MQFHNIDRLILSCVLSLVCLSCGSSMSDPKGMSDPQGSDAFETSLVRVTALDASGRAAFPNIGMDMLAAGEVEVEKEEQNEIKVDLTGAMPNMTYSVEFCSFATGTGGCFAVGSLETDNNGNAEVQLQFPQHGVFAGVFVLTRNNQSQFVSGFAAPASGNGQVEDDQEQGNEEAFEADLQRVGMVNAGLGPGFGPTGNDPLLSGRVEVKGKSEGGGENEGQGPVEVTVAGAVANATYMVEFCRFGVGPSGCFSLGSFATDMQGNAQAELAFSLPGTFDGIFVITRNVSGQDENEFVTGFVK
jgi:hypothetical protein